MQITINGVTISDYLDKYQCQIIDVFDTENSFEAIDGTVNEIYLGCKRVLTVDFEPMSTAQINQLFTAIKNNREITIKYIDPIEGAGNSNGVTRIFKCDNLPAATYFESDSPANVLFWTVPTITFTQIDIENDSQGSEGGYVYRLLIDSNIIPSNRISKELSLTSSISANGYSVGQIATGAISGKIYLNNPSDAFRYNAEIRVQRAAVQNGIQGDWYTLNVYYLKDFTINGNIMSFSGMDSMAFLDNNYYINYQRDNDGNVIPQTVSAHFTAISAMVKELTGHSEWSISSVSDDVPIQPQDEQNARSFITSVAESSCINYRQKITSGEQNDAVTTEGFLFGDAVTLTTSLVSDFEYSSIGQELETVIMYCGSTNKLPTYAYSNMYQDYNIYIIGNTPASGYPKAANTLEVKTPYYAFSAAGGGGRFANIIGTNFGTTFNISKVLLNNLIPIGARIVFSDLSLSNYFFYATSISYKLANNGIYASISGNSRGTSDSYYLGGMQRQLESKLSLNATYNNVYFDVDGIQFAAPKESV